MSHYETLNLSYDLQCIGKSLDHIVSSSHYLRCSRDHATICLWFFAFVCDFQNSLPTGNPVWNRVLWIRHNKKLYLCCVYKKTRVLKVIESGYRGPGWNITENTLPHPLLFCLQPLFPPSVSNSFQLSLQLLWNKTCLWGKTFLLAPLPVSLVSICPSLLCVPFLFALLAFPVSFSFYGYCPTSIPLFSLMQYPHRQSLNYYINFCLYMAW